MKLPYVVLSCCVLVTAAAAQGNFWVDGMTGMDSPLHGTSAAAPWRTIGYALANAPSPAIVNVAGNQTYGPAANGEVYPLVAVPGIAVQAATGSGAPRLALALGTPAFEFPAAASFGSTTRIVGLVFDGGSHGILLGSDIANTHSPSIVDCVFYRQRTTGVLIDNGGATIDAPEIARCTFAGSGLGPIRSQGVHGLAQTLDAATTPSIRDCDFHDVSTAVLLRADTAARCEVGGRVEGCQFATHDGGVALFAGDGGHYTGEVVGCRFTRCNVGLVMANGAFAPAPTSTAKVTGCVFFDCLAGINPQIGSGGSAQRLEVEGCTFFACDSGIDCYAVGDFTSHRILADLTFDSCNIGIRIDEDGAQGFTQAAITRCRVARCDRGIIGHLEQEGGQLEIDSTMVTECAIVGLDFDGFPGALAPAGSGIASMMTVRHATIADCGIGVAVQRPHALALIENSILAGNTQSLSLAANLNLGITTTCLENATWPGVGNLNFTTPELVRPFYKLSSSSPCLDAAAAGPTPLLDYERDLRRLRSTLGGPSLPDLGADEFAYSGSARTYGTGGRAPYEIAPRIGTQAVAAPIGATLQIDLSGAIAAVTSTSANSALLVIGWRDDSGNRPFDLAMFGMTGSYLWNDHIGTYPMQAVAPNGVASFGVGIPNQIALAGESFTTQWFALFPGKLGVVGSDGLRVTIGR